MHHANAMRYTLHSWVYVRYNFNFGQQSILSALGKGAINHAVIPSHGGYDDVDGPCDWVDLSNIIRFPYPLLLVWEPD